MIWYMYFDFLSASLFFWAAAAAEMEGDWPIAASKKVTARKATTKQGERIF